MKKIFSFLMITVLVTGGRVSAQADSTINPYEIYLKQYADLLSSRNVPEEDIRSMLKKFRDQDINTDEKLARALVRLYPSDQGIGVICFFLHGDTLRRVFMEPGRIVEQKEMIITREGLIQLGNDINHALGLYKKSENRMPVKRGFKVDPPPRSPNRNYDSVIMNASRLLLPEKLDTSYRHLLIVPVLNIGTLPFSILKPYADNSVLVERCSFTIVPGIIDLISLRGRIMKQSTKYWSGDLSSSFSSNYQFADFSEKKFLLERPLFVSNPSYPRNTEFVFPDLPGAKKEIDRAKVFASQFILLEGKQATRENVLKYLSGADLAYFATHGIADDKNPMEKSFLVLSGKEPFLTAKDIMQIRNAKTGEPFPEMVILSACQTGLGKAMDAGIVGLARSFLLAGSNHVIMSLWNVDDEATAYLMNRFIFHLQEPGKFMPSEPLRKAMLDAKKIYTSPSQWAGFAVFGINY